MISHVERRPGPGRPLNHVNPRSRANSVGRNRHRSGRDARKLVAEAVRRSDSGRRGAHVAREVAPVPGHAISAGVIDSIRKIRVKYRVALPGTLEATGGPSSPTFRAGG